MLLTMISIAMFNNKGGVGKTTNLCNLASWLQLKENKKVLLVDADPQCNTTTYVLTDNDFCDIYYEPKKYFTINDIILPLKTKGSYIEEDEIQPIQSKGFGFDLIAGNPKLATSEDFLSSDWKDIKASEIRGIRSNMVFFDLLNKTNEYDFVFFDMGPSLGALNRAVLLACDYFITPMSSDLFSILALENIGSSIIQWKTQFNESIQKLDSDEKQSLIDVKNISTVKFLGYIYQQYIMKTVKGNKRIVRAYENILNDLPAKMKEHLIIKINNDPDETLIYKLGSIPNFYSLIPMSQKAHKPLFNLGSADGVVGAHYQKIKEYEYIMNEISSTILKNIGAVNILTA